MSRLGASSAVAKEAQVVVVGGAGDIGLAVSRTFHVAGFHVESWDPGHDSDQMSHPWCTRTQSILDVPIDILRGSSVRHVVNCAGGPATEEFATQHLPSLKVLHNTMRLNLDTAYVCAQILESGELDGDKSLTVLSSVNALGRFGLPAYSLAKGSIQSMTVALAVHMMKSHVRINCITLGTTDTSNWRSLWEINNERDSGLAVFPETPTGHVVSPQQVASAAFWLATNTSVVGSNILIDNGQSL